MLLKTRVRSNCGNTAWVTIHDTAVNGTTPFDSIALAMQRMPRLSSCIGRDQPIRVLAQGRDSSATLDSLFGTTALGFTGTFNNEGDNEITGWHLSDGDPTVLGLLGQKIRKPLKGQWRLFYTQQHGDNFT